MFSRTARLASASTRATSPGLRASRWVEVEAEAVGRDERAGLADVLAEDLTQGGVEDVSGGVVAHRVAAAGLVDAGLDGVADAQAAGLEAADVGDDAALADGPRVLDDEVAAGPDDLAPVADLAAALGVEGRLS